MKNQLRYKTIDIPKDEHSNATIGDSTRTTPPGQTTDYQEVLFFSIIKQQIGHRYMQINTTNGYQLLEH